MPPSTVYCDNCGAANRPQSKFCVSCGKTLAGGQVYPSSTGLLAHHHLLKQRYRLIGQLGQGGFGAVYKAEDMQFGNALRAVKEMAQSSLNAQGLHEAIDAFKREAVLLAGLMHPNLPRIYDHFSDGGRWYLVMDYIDGETLERRLEKAGGGKLPIEEVLNIGIQLSTVLSYLHTHQPSIIFRDLKPTNVMLTDDGHLYLIDFGIARLFKPGQARDTTALGSSGYAAPEQYGKAQTTASADIYSLGATLHQLISGSDPSLDPLQFLPLRLSNQPGLASLELLIMQMVETSKDKRPSSMAAVKQELQRIATLQVAGPPLVTTPGTLATSPKTKEQWLTEGNTLLDFKRYQEALTAFEQAIRLDSNFALAHRGKGAVLYYLTRYEEALTAFEQAIRLDSNFALAHRGKGTALLFLGRYQEALASYEQAIRLAPNDALAYANKGGALGSLRRYYESLVACEQAIRLDPNYALAYAYKGNALLFLGRYQEALVAFEQAIRLDDNFADAHYKKGWALSELGRYQEGLVAFEQAIRLDPNSANTYNKKGWALSELRRYQEGLVAFEQAIRLDPNSANAYNNKSWALNDLGRYQEALVACEQAIRLDPSFTEAYNNKGLALLSLGYYQEGLVACEQAIRLDPNVAKAYANKGAALISLGYYKEGLVACEQAIRLDPNVATAYANKGAALISLGHYKKGLVACEQAIRLDPSLTIAYSNKSLALNKLGRYK